MNGYRHLGLRKLHQKLKDPLILNQGFHLFGIFSIMITMEEDRFVKFVLRFIEPAQNTGRMLLFII